MKNQIELAHLLNLRELMALEELSKERLKNASMRVQIAKRELDLAYGMSAGDSFAIDSGIITRAKATAAEVTS